MPEALSLDELRGRLIAACDRVLANVEVLTKADKAIGDGDHGVTMARGFKAARERLAAPGLATAGDLFKATGTALLSTCGGASGAIFGTLFRSAAKGLQAVELDGPGFAQALEDGLAGVQKVGGAEPGDKTVIDAIEPAAKAARAAAGNGIDQTLTAAATAAAEGVEATRAMVAKAGKAKTLSERAKGHADPGAITFSLVLAALTGAVEEC